MDFILSKLRTAWWTKAIEFYAALKGDISSLLRATSSYEKTGFLGDRVFELIALAPHTPKRVVQKLALPDSETGQRKYSWERVVDLHDLFV